MDNIIPLPTDNIYKFYALFGLLLVIFVISAVIYLNQSTNELIFSSELEYEILKTIKNPTPVDLAKIKQIEKKIEIILTNKKFMVNSIGVLLAIALIAIVYGFFKWHLEVQPLQDEIMRSQLEKLKHELQMLNDNVKP